MSGRIVEIRIDELALEAVAPADRGRVAAVASAELQRLLADHGEWAGRSGDVVAPPGALEIEAAGSPEAIGRSLARTLHARLAR